MNMPPSPIITQSLPVTPKRVSNASCSFSNGVPSPCATSTTTTPTAASRSTEYSFSSNSTYSRKYTVRMETNDFGVSGPPLVPPSPSRSILDPQYATRLKKSQKYGSDKTQSIVDFRLMPPPGIHRGAHGSSNSAFCTPTNSFSSSGSVSMTEEINDSHNTSFATASSSSSTPFHTPERPETTPPCSNTRMRKSSIIANTNMMVPSLAVRTVSPSSSRYQPLSHSPSSKATSTPSPAGFLGSGLVTPTFTPARNRRQRQSHLRVTTPGSNSSKECTYSDRFIPSRVTSNLEFSVWGDSEPSEQGSGNYDNYRMQHGSGHAADAAQTSTVSSQEGRGEEPGSGASSRTDVSSGSNNQQSQQPQQTPLLNVLLRSELLGENADPAPQSSPSRGRHSNQSLNSSPATPLREGGNFFRYNQSPRQTHLDELYSSSHNPTSVVNSFNLSPVGSSSSHRLLSMPQKRKRRIAKVPFKVLDAPALADDFYLNLVDWSSLNVLAVGLGSCVYLWSACTSKVTKLCDLGQTGDNAVTSVAWTQRGTHLAVGINSGQVQIWDTIQCKKIRTMSGHSARIGTLSWSGPTLASGSRDRLIYLRDVRVQQPFTARLASHKQEVCGLKWSFEEPAHLASGGNDNKLLVWDVKNHRMPVHRFAEHSAAVKAIAWSPHQHGLLASGGGTADRCIRFWNALSGTALSCMDTGSQVCNLAWSQNCNELVSTHGYSLNQIVVWKYPTMQKVTTLTGHTYRVLYLAMSPDGSTIVTGAGDETLRFWQVFPGPRSHDKSSGNGLLFPSSPGSILR